MKRMSLAPQWRETVAWPISLMVTAVGSALLPSSLGPIRQGRPNNISISVHSYAILVMGVAAAAVGAWQYARSKRSGLLEVERASPRTRSELAIRALAPVWTWFAVGYLSLLAFMMALSAYSSGQWWPSPWITLLTLAVLACQVALGAVIGRLLPWYLSPIVAASMVYGLYVWQLFAVRDERAQRLVPVIQEIWDPGFAPNGRSFLAVILWVASGALVLGWLAIVEVDRWFRPVTVLVLLTALLACATVLLRPASYPSFLASAKSEADPHVCVNGASGGVVCAYQGEASSLPARRSGLQRANQAIAGLRPARDSAVQTGLGPLGGPNPIVVDGTPGDTENDYVRLYLEEMIPGLPDGCVNPPSSADSGWVPWDFFVREVLLDRAQVPFRREPGLDQVWNRFSALSRSQQDAWMSEAMQAIARCSLPPALGSP